MAISGGDGSVILTTKVDESGLKKGLGSIKKLGATAGEAFLAIGVAAGAATVAITKMATDAYADYEQLVGGVETLFKGSAQKVIDYANDAFYTAGVSANEYMKQVTSFSASLIRSTAGDTDKAADIANMALIDISDNVNKMGSSMESVTLAYQGFAKQQYMLLDNLKLGYGGTKTEMERLLKDAQALTGVKYDINNLADVYSAIHAIQENLGVTGTTAKEAEKTVTGSANMMKAAWQNVLSAIAGGGNLDRAINNLVYSIQKYFENIVPVVERSLQGIGQLIEKVAPLLVQSVAKALIKAIPNLLNAIYQMIVGLAKGIAEGIKVLLVEDIQGASVEIKNSVEGAGGAINDLGNEVQETNQKIKKSLAGFDDLQVITSGISESIEDVGSLGAIESTGSFILNYSKNESTKSPFLEGLLNDLADAFSGYEDIDFNNINKSLGGFSEQIKKLANLSWESLLKHIKKVLVPIQEFMIEETTPRLFETLTEVLKIFNTVLEKTEELIMPLWENFLLPIVLYAGDKLNEIFDKLNDALKKMDDRLSNSTVWEDIGTILETIYPIIEPTVKALIDFVTWVGKLVVDVAWETFSLLLSDIEDALGMIVDIINGDYEDAWEKFKDFMIDNNVEFAKNAIDDLKTSFEELTTTLENVDCDKLSFDLGAGLANLILELEDFRKIWVEKTTDWWNNDVVPFFSGIEWGKIGENAINGLKNAVTFGLQNLINGAIDLLNGFIDGWNSVATTSGFLPVIGRIEHASWFKGASGGAISGISAPVVAMGTRLPTNTYGQTSLGGDNILNRVLDAVNSAVSSAATQTTANTEIVLEIDGREFGRAVVEQGNRENRRIGTRLAVV